MFCLHHTWSLLLDSQKVASVSNRGSHWSHNNIVACRIDPADVTSMIGQMLCEATFRFEACWWNIAKSMGYDQPRLFVPKYIQVLFLSNSGNSKRTLSHSNAFFYSKLRKVRTNFLNCQRWKLFNLGPLIGYIFGLFLNPSSSVEFGGNILASWFTAYQKQPKRE